MIGDKVLLVLIYVKKEKLVGDSHNFFLYLLFFLISLSNLSILSFIFNQGANLTGMRLASIGLFEAFSSYNLMEANLIPFRYVPSIKNLKNMKTDINNNKAIQIDNCGCVPPAVISHNI